LRGGRWGEKKKKNKIKKKRFWFEGAFQWGGGAYRGGVVGLGSEEFVGEGDAEEGEDVRDEAGDEVAGDAHHFDLMAGEALAVEVISNPEISSSEQKISEVPGVNRYG
jgi:hypothetical protein